MIIATSLAVGICQIGFARRQKPRNADGITQQQAAEMVEELKQIRLLLERIDKDSALHTSARANPTRVKVKIDGGYGLGRKSAPIILAEFADYQCPFCRQFQLSQFERLRKKYIDAGWLRFVALDLPLPNHDYAPTAAEAALCAGEQFKFWQMRELMLASAEKLTGEVIRRDAQELQLDSSLFAACLESARYASKVASDVAQAKALGIQATPTFVLGKVENGELKGVEIVAAPSYSELEASIEELLAQRK
jgi:protein-disulfide isomerase